MEYYGAPNDYRGYLKHHGIKGQKWGVRNGPPYPLDAKDHSKREQKANWRSSLKKGDSEKKKRPLQKTSGSMADIVDYAKKHPEVSIPAATAAIAALGKGAHSISRHVKNKKEDYKRNLTVYDHSTNQRFKLKHKLSQKEKVELSERMKKGEKRIEALRNMGLIKESKLANKTDGNNLLDKSEAGKKYFDKEKALKALKIAAIVGGVAVGAAVVANIAKHYEVGYEANYKLDPDRLFYTVKDYERDFNDTLNNLMSTSKVKSVKDLARIPANKISTAKNSFVTNPGWPIPGRTMNCTFCSANMAMREKGYDTVARMTPNGFDTEDLYNKLFPTANREHIDRSALKSWFSNLSEGSYGEMSVQWSGLFEGGHSVFWKIENSKPVIYDSQVNQKYSIDKLIRSISKEIQISDLTNADPSDFILAAVMPR